MDPNDLPHGVTPSPVASRIGVTLTEISAERTVGSVPVEPNLQPWGVLHGGVSAFLAEELASIAASMHAGPDGTAVGVDLNATHHRAARSGVVTGVATAIHLGRSVASYQVEITDDEQRRLCTARLTCFLKRPAVPSS